MKFPSPVCLQIKEFFGSNQKFLYSSSFYRVVLMYNCQNALLDLENYLLRVGYIRVHTFDNQ